MHGRRALPAAGPTVWNSLGNDLRDPDLIVTSFGSTAEETSVSAVLGARSAL